MSGPLGAQRANQGSLSKFIEETVRRRLFHRTLQDVRERNADTDTGELRHIIDEGVSDVRAERHANRR